MRDAHRHFPGALAPSRDASDAALAEPPAVAFTGEEAGGRWLDLTGLHRAYCNAPFGVAGTDYLAFLDALLAGLPRLVPRPKEFSRAYSAFLGELSAYLVDFQRRAHPLSYSQPALDAARAAFDADWPVGKVAGWEDRGVGGSGGGGEASDASSQLLDLDVFSSPEEVASLGPAAVKDALTRLGLKAGGTDGERAARLFATRGKRLEDIDRKLFVKGRAPLAGADAAKAEAEAMAIARAEVECAALLSAQRETLAATRGNAEKRSTLSFEEREMERLEEEEDGGVDVGDDTADIATIYNPLKLPMGWDGKPIPYWLYKLHGLNQEFKCEICGNESYWGRRAYERHFREPRHQHGLRCLKIPNSKAFLEVTSIKDAVALHAAMVERGASTFRTDADEEFEDASGNVYNKKTYTLLQRQGLL